MRTCKIRTVRGHNMRDKLTTYERLERRFKRKLDRRRNYCVVKGELCESGEWSEGCSGCGGFGDVAGSGCHECGHNGRVIVGMWVPVSVCDELRKELKHG